MTSAMNALLALLVLGAEEDRVAVVAVAEDTKLKTGFALFL
jgi:hypothetical protein